MAIKLRPSTEESTYIVTVSFFDVDGNAVTPKLASWTLKDEEGLIVNNRSEVIIDSPKETNIIVLTGDDLALPDPTKPYRYVLVEAVYDSVLYGNDLNLRDEGQFKIRNLVAK